MLEPPVAYRADPPRRLVLKACGASLPIWSCSVWGLPCPPCHHGSGALLPHLFTLTPARGEQALYGMLGSLAKAQVAEAVYSLWHWPSMSLDAHVPDVIRHTALWSSDFPPLSSPRGKSSSDRPAPLLFLSYRALSFLVRFGNDSGTKSTAWLTMSHAVYESNSTYVSSRFRAPRSH